MFKNVDKSMLMKLVALAKPILTATDVGAPSANTTAMDPIIAKG